MIKKVVSIFCECKAATLSRRKHDCVSGIEKTALGQSLTQTGFAVNELFIVVSLVAVVGCIGTSVIIIMLLINID